MRGSLAFTMLAVCMVATSCDRNGEGAVERSNAATGDSAVAEASEPVDSATMDHADHVAGDGAPAPLLEIMRTLDAEMLKLTHALMTEDREGVVSAAAAIAEHAPIAPADLDRVRRELGDDMAEFERLDEEVHEASVRLSETAETGQMYEVVDRLAEVQRGCIACHTLYRIQLYPRGQ